MLLLGLVVLSPAAAQAQSYRFSNVKIEGNQRIEPGTILSYAGIARGATVSAGDLNAAYQRLIGSGLFEAVNVEPQGGTLVIKVTEYPTINVINIEGNKRLKDEDILRSIESKPRRVYSPTLAEQDAASIVAAYKQMGRLSATVTPRIIRRSENRVDLVFEVVEGKVSEVERLSFVGNRDFSDRRLRRVLGTKQAGFLHQFIQADTFVAERIDFDKQVLRDFYLSRGYIDFKVRSVSSEFSREKDAFFLTFDVQEGQSYRVGKVSVVSEVPDANAADFESQLKIRPGVTYNPALVDNVISRMEGLAEKKGLTFIRVDPRITRHEPEGLLDIAFTLVRGPRVFVERIDIEGNATTLDRVIRSQFNTVEGDPFNPREIRQAAERIRALGFFKTADVQAKQGSASDQVVVDVNVEEQSTGSLSFGASFSQDTGIGANVAFAETNFLGRGQNLAFTVVAVSGSRTYNFSFSDPNALGRHLTLGLNAGYRETNDFNSNYSTRTGEFTPSIGFPVSDHGRLTLRFSLTYSDLTGVDNGDSNGDGFNDGDTNMNGVIDGTEVLNTGSSAVLRRDEAKGPVWRSGLGYTYSYDTRTTGLNPLGGIFLRFGQDFTGLGGSDNYIKTSVLASAERKVMNENVTLRATFEGGAITMLSGQSRITDRYLLSSQQIRGFEYGGIGPRDLNVSNRDALGGNYFAVARFEAEFPLGLPDEYGVTGGAFMDFGSLWGLDDNAGGPSGANPVDDRAHLRSTIGLSLLWASPFGPLRLNFSRPIQKQDYDKTQSFDISVSTRF